MCDFQDELLPPETPQEFDELLKDQVEIRKYFKNREEFEMFVMLPVSQWQKWEILGALTKRKVWAIVRRTDNNYKRWCIKNRECAHECAQVTRGRQKCINCVNADFVPLPELLLDDENPKFMNDE